MYRQKRTAKGIQNAIRFVLGIDISASSPFNADTLIRGESKRGINWGLGPSDRFARYALTSRSRASSPIANAASSAPSSSTSSPRTPHFVDLIKPLPPILPNHWEMDLSDLEETTDLH